MSSSPEQLAAPPVDVLLGEMVATLLYAAVAYLEPGKPEAEVDVESAEIVVDVAGLAFDRIASRLSPDARGALTGMLTDARLTVVRKRG